MLNIAKANRASTSIWPGRPCPLAALLVVLLYPVKNSTMRMYSTAPVNGSWRNKLAFRRASADLTEELFASGLKYVEHPCAVQDMTALVKHQTTMYDIV